MVRYKIFLKTVDNLSFTKTAEEFGYTQSAVSQIIKTLEREFKVTLFTRTKHGIILTADGKALVPYIRKLCNDYDDALYMSDSIRRLEGAIIRIGAFASASSNFLPGLIKSFKEIYPSVQFKLMQGEYDTIRSWITDGTIDFGFLSDETAHGFDYTNIFKDEMVMIMQKGHPLASKNPLTLADFCEDPFIFNDKGKLSEPRDYFSREGLTPNLQYRVFDDLTILNMVEQGLGISIIPSLVLRNHTQQLEIKSLTPAVYRNICVACKKDGSISVAGKTFMDYTIENIGKMKNA